MNILVEALFNAHSHIREGEDVMRDLIALLIQGGADTILAMPNTTAGLTTCEQVLLYDRQAHLLVQPGKTLATIPTLMITEEKLELEIEKCVNAGVRDGKVFPLNRTTKSQNGVRDYSRLIPKIRVCGEVGMNVHLHPEHPWMAFGNRDAEFCFLPIADMFLRETNATIVWEHGTDSRCIPFWKEMAATGRFFVTLTAHHLAGNEDQALGDVRMVCKPPLRTEHDRLGLIQLVAENHNWVMAGGDDAPHNLPAKHVHNGQCACGEYTAPFLMQLYAHALDELLQSEAGRQIFVNFTSRNARAFHNHPPASATRLLVRQEFLVPDFYQVGSWRVEPPWAGKKIRYSFSQDQY